MDKLTCKPDAERIEFCQGKGIIIFQHCCLDMAWFISKPVEWEDQGENPVIMWMPEWDEYRIEVSREGVTSTLIYHCPWCGKKLPESKCSRWFGTLYELGFKDPVVQDIPPEFNSDAWWRKGEG